MRAPALSLVAPCAGDLDRWRVNEFTIVNHGSFRCALESVHGLPLRCAAERCRARPPSLPTCPVCARSPSPPHRMAAGALSLPSPLPSSSLHPHAHARIYLQQILMRQRMDAQDSGGGVFDTYEKLRQANSEKLQTLLSRTARRTTATGGGAQRVKKSASLTGDYLDYEDDAFADKWINLGMGLMVALALVLFYVLWFTDWVR
ncbi:hypothetical protein, unknown function [Leishmania mexicana MHOM/GT/2001/U1103]|uniref:Uncharacterized protein n=1 Tax=Leishmania mexicana (strain MHOM/GT/2001/U1103) TaxID=929439 RepID=E9AS60_LEIMU|nr:hypothetical protein, unknown function [Leishmania mexicana MHOM/GT/2001/U1103]CBZ25781.1 hypothetical protein, unknown function [Leishmania mexicana MHOM/GT/2001/U1103]